MGPIEESLGEQIEEYRKLNAAAAAAGAAAAAKPGGMNDPVPAAAGLPPAASAALEQGTVERRPPTTAAGVAAKQEKKDGVVQPSQRLDSPPAPRALGQAPAEVPPAPLEAIPEHGAAQGEASMPAGKP